MGITTRLQLLGAIRRADQADAAHTAAGRACTRATRATVEALTDIGRGEQQLAVARGRAQTKLRRTFAAARPANRELAALAVGRWPAAKSFPDIAAVTGWLHLIAALVVAGVGLSMLLRHLRRREHHHRGQGHDHVLGGGHGLGGGGRRDGGPGAGRGTARGAVTPVRERQRTRRRSHPCHCRRRRRLVQRWSPQGQMVRLI
ncbi:hypothetical protein ACFRCI_15965 [Streptomyces sp. NPDC056638]|uniref:hypothetical protein n=1 Tax=Streptomyces sp. NPDC056638 TaxID=3345887 RepID=UPI0036A04983